MCIYIYVYMLREIGSSQTHWQPTEPDLVLKVIWTWIGFQSAPVIVICCPQLDEYQGDVHNFKTPNAWRRSRFSSPGSWCWALEPPGSATIADDICRIGFPYTIEWLFIDTGDFWNHTRLSYDCVPIFSFAQVTPYLLLAFCFKVRSSSKIRKRPSCKTVLKRLVSITLVKQSASIMAVEIHLHCIWSLDCSFRSITSIVVLHSWQLGTAFFITKS